MKKTTYIFILALLSSNFLDILPFGSFLAESSGLWGFVALFTWLLMGFFIYGASGYPRLSRWKNNAPVVKILLGVFLSMFVALYLHGQSLWISIEAYRVQYFWIVIPVLLYVKPSEEELIKPLTLFAAAYFIAILLRTYVAPNWFYYSESKIQYSMRNPDEIVFGAGLQIVLVPFYYYCSKVRERLSVKVLIVLGLFLALFLLIQNRSVLFVAGLIAAYCFLSGGGILRVGLLSVFLVVFFYQTWDIWSNLLEETTTQINDADYARFRSIKYFIDESRGDWVRIIFGNGLLSARVSSRIQDLGEMGIYNSDVGLFGYWNNFGIIPVIVIVYYLVKALLARHIPFYVKAIGLHILLCAGTISHFGSFTIILWYSFFYYLYVYYNEQQNMQYDGSIEES